MSCWSCGDSKRHPRKARGYVTQKYGKPVYTCHKCGLYLPFHRALQAFDPNLYAEYQKERVVAGFWRSGSGDAPDSRSLEDRQEAKPPVVSDDPLRPLTRVDRLPEDHVAVRTCADRMIPDLSRLYHCPLFYRWVNWALRTEKFKPKAVELFDHPRLVIPFVVGGRVTAFQGRDYRQDSDNKYITIRLDEDTPKVYGLDRFDPSRLGYAVEGPIDSMFIDNCVAFAGGDHSILNTMGYDRDGLVVVYDNEPRSKTTRKKIERAIDDGYPVCVWPRGLTEKDPNDMVLSGLDPKKIIDENTHRGLRAKLELSIWRNG